MTDPLIGAIAELKRYAADEHGTASYLTKAEAAALLSLLIEADSFISHMQYRSRSDVNDVDRLVGKLRRAS
jgi:hypothetical protein